MVIKIRNYIGNKYVEPEGEGKYDVYNPALGEVIAKVSESTREEVNNAIDLAHSAFIKWSETPVPDRIKLLFKLQTLMYEHMDEIAEITTKEHGKTFEEAKGDLVRAIQNVESAVAATYSSMGVTNKNISRDIDEELIKVPLGVFAIVSPFNFPAMIPFWFAPYAIALGNTVVIKPSERTPMTMNYIIDLFRRAGIPENVVQLVNGGKDTVDYLIENDKIVGVSFVGSTPVAKYIYSKAKSLKKRVQAGASAKNFVLVMPDADLKSTINNIIGSFFGNAGERCLAGSVLVTFKENHDAVRDLFVQEARKLRVGYGLEKNIDMGPLIRKEHKEKVESYIQSGIDQGAKLLLDGRTLKVDMYPNGFFLGPSIFDDVSLDMKIGQEEIFGPVASIMTVDNFDEAIEKINSSKYGNASSIYTRSGYYAREYVKRVEAGNIGINIGVAAPISFYPFAGMKDSFFGEIHPQGGLEHVDFFTDRKVVISKWYR